MSVQAPVPDDDPKDPEDDNDEADPKLPPDPLPGSPSKSKLDRSPDLSRLSRHSYIAGIVGSFVIMIMGYLAMKREVLSKGWNLYPSAEPASIPLSVGFALLVVATAMFAVELGIRLKVDWGRIVRVDPRLRDGRIGWFLLECVLVFAVDLATIAVGFAFYRMATEYGIARGAEYYKPWVTLMPYIWWIYVCGGLPYVLVTRALQHEPKSDRKQSAFVIMRAVYRLAIRLGLVKPVRGREPKPLGRYDRSAMLGLGVKLFFVPLMTVFFCDQFTHLVRNYHFVLNDLIPGGKRPSVGDFYNISFTVIFSIDVGLAWGGYALSSRWIKNTIFSAEPTFLGWAVALLCYPPINHNFGMYFQTPGENAFLSIDLPIAVRVLAVFSVLSFIIYTSATVCFGLRFSNLTHRGIITTGPYAYVRHPAYAAKNFSWWCVMLPYALYTLCTSLLRGTDGWIISVYQIIGLFVTTTLYYWRAITEERHLGRDPEYRLYARKVRYRFVPGVI